MSQNVKMTSYAQPRGKSLFLFDHRFQTASTLQRINVSITFKSSRVIRAVCLLGCFDFEHHRHCTMSLLPYGFLYLVELDKVG